MYKRNFGRHILNILRIFFLYFAVILIVIIIIAPYLWMVSCSFKSSIEIVTSDITVPDKQPKWIPQKITLYHYNAVNQNVPMLSYLKNSMIISIGTAICTIILSLFAAYGLTRYKFNFKKKYEFLLYSTQMFPGVAFLIPYFILFIYVKKITGFPMRNTYHGLIFTYTSFSLPFAILMMKDFLRSIPIEIDEQAELDGCNRFQILFKIILPISTPGIVSIAIYSFVMSWNEIFFATQIAGRETKPVSLGLMDYVTLNTANWGGMMAACIVVSIPVLILFIIMQRHIVGGYVQSGIR